MNPNYQRPKKDEIDKFFQKGENFTKNGQCSRCGACCTHHLNILPSEQKEIKEYIKTHKIRPVHHTGEGPSVDFLCPFLDNKDENHVSCTIYPVRPAICRAYRCDLAEKESGKNIQDELWKKHIPLQELINCEQEVHTGSLFYPKEYLPKPGDPVIINMLHIRLFQKYYPEIFLATDEYRIHETYLEVKLMRKDGSHIWCDRMGLTVIRNTEKQEDNA